MLKFLFSSRLISSIISGCNTNIEEEDIFKFKDPYVGCNSALGNIVNQLQAAEYLNFTIKAGAEGELPVKEKELILIFVSLITVH